MYNDSIIICKNPMELSKQEIDQILDSCAPDFPYSIGSTLTNREYINEKLYKNAHWVLSYDHRNSLMGFIAYYINTSFQFLYIPYVWVNQNDRGRHCGTNMIQVLKRQIQETIREIRLEVRKDNVTAIDFYLRNGFIVSEDRLEKYLLVHIL